MSLHHVRVAAAAVAILVVMPPAVVLSASAGTAAVAAVYSRIAPWVTDAMGHPAIPRSVAESAVRRPWEYARRNAAQPAMPAPASYAAAAEGARAAHASDAAEAEPAYVLPSPQPPQFYAYDLAASREAVPFTPEPDPPASARAPAIRPPPPSAAVEQPPFALILLVEIAGNPVTKTFSPLSYPGRGACEQAGRQWESEAAQSVEAEARALCIPHAAYLLAMQARLQAAMPTAGSVP